MAKPQIKPKNYNPTFIQLIQRIHSLTEYLTFLSFVFSLT